MKAYFHLTFMNDEFKKCLLTSVFSYDSQPNYTILSSLSLICKQVQTKYEVQLEPPAYNVYSKNKLLSQDTCLSTLPDGVDLQVKINKEYNPKEKIVYERTVISKQSEKTKKTTTVTKPTPEVEKLLAQAQKHVTKKQLDIAVDIYKEILLEHNPNTFAALYGLAYIYFRACRYADSIAYFEKVVSKDSSNVDLLLDYTISLKHTGNHKKAVSVISRCINDIKRAGKTPEKMHDANTVLGAVLEAMGEQESAFQVYLNIAQLTDKQHVDGLVGYARVGYKLNQVTLDSVFVVLLNAIARKPKDEAIRQLFAEMLQHEGGYQALQSQMQDAWNDASTLVYIATMVREYGALNMCRDLLQRALLLQSASVDTCLLLIHVFENLRICPLDHAAKFLSGKLDRQVLRRVDLSSVTKIVKLIKDGNREELATLLDTLGKREAKSVVLKGSMSENELQLLAIYFTVVKTLFVAGELEAASTIAKLVQPLFAANENLHKTLIKNEQAYFSCISQLFSPHCPPPTYDDDSPDNKYLYVIGDSHVMPLSWRQLKIKDVAHVTRPVLVTGLKVWHLRAESKFYTKASFELAMESVPNGASCLFVLGEIDCREGVSQAVDACLYDSFEACCDRLADIYARHLSAVQKRKKLKIFVSPVSPLHTNAATFNASLKKRLVKSPRLVWLDFADMLLNEDGSLKTEYLLDGIHLHPNYLQLVQQTLDNTN